MSPEEAQVLETSLASDSGGFLSIIYKHFGSQFFFTGYVFFAIGSLLSIALSFAELGTGLPTVYLGVSIFFLVIISAFSVVPIIGLWKIYNACNKQDDNSVEGILGGLTLLKIIVMVLNVLMWIITVLFGIAAIVMLFSSVVEFIALAMVTVFMLLIIKFYFFAFFRIVYSVRRGIQTGKLDKVEGAGSYTILSFIAIAFGLLVSVISMVSGPLDDVYRDGIGSEFDEFFAALAPAGFSFAMVSSLLSSVGLVLLIIVLRKFAAEIRTKGR